MPALPSAHRILVERTTPEHFRKAMRTYFCSNSEPLKKKERAKKTINCHHSDVLWKFKMSSFLVRFSHKIFPLFNRFSTFGKNVNLSKANPEAENFFLVSPSLNTSTFTTYLKIASTLTPFKGLDSKVTLPNSKA